MASNLHFSQKLVWFMEKSLFCSKTHRFIRTKANSTSCIAKISAKIWLNHLVCVITRCKHHMLHHSSSCTSNFVIVTFDLFRNCFSFVAVVFIILSVIVSSEGECNRDRNKQFKRLFWCTFSLVSGVGYYVIVKINRKAKWINNNIHSGYLFGMKREFCFFFPLFTLLCIICI